jgi:hypothetical protein
MVVRVLGSPSVCVQIARDELHRHHIQHRFCGWTLWRLVVIDRILKPFQLLARKQ